CPRQRYGRKLMIDSSRRTVLTTGAAAAATAAAPQVFAQAPQTSAPQGAPADAKTGYYEKGNVRIRYTEIGTGFPLLATPGGGLNSRIAVWANAVINIPEEFTNDFRVITMDQRNATGGESTGPVPVDDPWGTFADDQLGLMDHLGIRQFFFFGNHRRPVRDETHGASGAARRRRVAEPAGRTPAGAAGLHVQFWTRRLGQGVPRAPARRADGNDREIPAQPLPRAARFRVQRVARLREVMPDADAGAARRRDGASAPGFDRHRLAGAERRDHGVSLEGSAGAEGPHHQPGAHLPEAAPAGVSPDVLFCRRWPAERFAHAGRAFHCSSSRVTLSRHQPAHAV